jgi:hypothetical protein
MPIPKLYDDHFVKKADERTGLFQALSAEFTLQRGLYPGCFTHITPSFFIPEMVYVDLDKRCPAFFADDATVQFVAARKQYAQTAAVRFYNADFSKEIPEPQQSFDLLLSFYAGFISEYCTRYLRQHGILVVNNSHGDAPLAYLNPAYRLIGIVNRKAERFNLAFDQLNGYFVTKSGKPLIKEELLQTMRGPAYTKAPYAYIFEKT